MTIMLLHAPRLLILIVLMVLPLSSHYSLANAAPRHTRVFQHYVSLGDSFASGPLASPISDTSSCQRSQANYAHLIALALHIRDLKDVSCVGATIKSLGFNQSPNLINQKAQFDALNGQTDLVTINMGAQDASLITLARLCANGVLANMQHEITDIMGIPRRPGVNCGALDEHGFDPYTMLITGIGATYGQVISSIHSHAPHATIFVIGYPELVRSTGCSAMHADNAQYIQTKIDQLNAVLKTSADNSGAIYFDTKSLSDGHDLCAASDQSWIQGPDEFSLNNLSYNYILHPKREYYSAVARALIQKILSLS